MKERWPRSVDNADRSRDKPPSRRDFLKGALAASGVAATSALTGPRIADAVSELIDAKGLESATNQAIHEIREKYGVNVNFDADPNWSAYETDEAGTAQKERAVRFLKERLNKYPPQIMRDRFEAINIRNNLQHEKHGRLIEGQAFPETKSMIVEFGGRFITGRLFGWRESVFNEVFDHELFHLLDTIDNERWVALTPGGMQTYRRHVEELTPFLGTGETPGFAENYGTRSPFEDKATVFEWLFRDYDSLCERSKTDDILKKKADVVRTYVMEISNGLMGTEYWSIVQNEDFSDAYFSTRSERLQKMEFTDFLREEPDISISEDVFKSWKLPQT